MSERIMDARYTSPSGKEASFEYETLKRSTELKTGIFTFPNRDGAHVQHQGMGARSEPLLCIFTGENYMDNADAFEAMLCEKGTGELQIPYGTFKVVPTGNIEREDDFVSGIGESHVTITFTESITEDASELNSVAADDIDDSLNAFEEAACEDFARSMETDNIDEQMENVSNLNAMTETITQQTKKIVSKDKSKFANFLTSINELKDNISNLYKNVKDALGKVKSVYTKALNIARLTLRVMRLASEMIASAAQAVAGFAEITAGIIKQFKNDPFGIAKIKNAFKVAWLGITGAIASVSASSAKNIAASAASVSSTEGTASQTTTITESDKSSSGGATTTTSNVLSREDVIELSNQLLVMLDSAKEFSDAKVELDAFVDSDAEAYTALITVVTESVQLIQNASFALPMQKTITLNRDRNLIELCAELYGSVDDSVLDQFITVNKLNIDTLQLLPMGRKVSYYVQSA